MAHWGRQLSEQLRMGQKRGARWQRNLFPSGWPGKASPGEVTSKLRAEGWADLTMHGQGKVQRLQKSRR